MTATTDRCPGCHGSGIEMSGVTYAGMSEYVGCHECGPECPDYCGCRASDATERPESIAPRHPGATQSPDGSQGATEGLRGPEGATGPTSDVRPSPTARDAVSDAEAAEWAALADAVTEGSWHFIALARTAVPRLLADRERLVGANARMRQVAELRVGTWRDTAARLEGERDRARGTAATLEAENARLVEEATVSAALLETEIAKRESAEMRANRATADLDALESEDRRQDVQAKHWREVLRIRRELDGIRQEMNDATEIIAKALGYRPSGLPLDGWPHLSTTGDHTPTSLAAEAAGVLAKASRLRAGIEALAAEMQADTCPACHVSYADEGSTTWGCDHTEGMQHAGDMLRALLAEGGE